ncbi:MAG: hypothetical protein PUP91_18725 [Rhizonema sp. PD37]|nr:hypothetical protein [Rhizonema sp. PD37]
MTRQWWHEVLAPHGDASSGNACMVIAEAVAIASFLRIGDHNTGSLEIRNRNCNIEHLWR